MRSPALVSVPPVVAWLRVAPFGGGASIDWSVCEMGALDEGALADEGGG